MPKATPLDSEFVAAFDRYRSKFWSYVPFGKADDCWEWTGVINKSSGYPSFDVHLKGKVFRCNTSAIPLAKRFGVSDKTIRMIIWGKRWSHISYA